MKKALLLLCLFALPAISQSDPVTSIPGNPTVFVITLNPDGQVIYGAIEVRGKFIEGRYPDDDRDFPSFLVVHFDTPGNVREDKISKADIRDVQPEAGPLRLKRYDQAGYVVAMDAKGVETLVSETQLAQVQRLQELQQGVASAQEQHIAAYRKTELPATAEMKKAGFASLWGPHIVTVFVAGLLLVLIWKTCFQSS